jgi:hypothetical protein
MVERLLHYCFRYGADVVSIVLAAVGIGRRRSGRPSWTWPAAVVLGLAFVAGAVHDARVAANWGHDFRLCWRAGAYVLEGRDPYTITGLRPPHDKEPALYYPPYALPLFRIFALVPERTAVGVWTAVNILIGLVLGLIARRALIAQDGEGSPVVEPWVAALLTGSVILSLDARFALEAGQFSFLVAFALLGALTAQAGKPGRPATAAACLTVASLKVQTMAPFLLLFLRRSDRRTWLFLGLFLAVLLLGASNPADLPDRIRSFFAVLAEGRRPGFAGDASLLNNMSHTMIGFDHALSRMGIADPSLRGAFNYLGIATLGAWLGYLALRQPAISRGAMCALVSLYSMLFLYHRLYDLVVLIVPMVYCASRFHACSGPARWCHGGVMVAIVLALNVPYGEFFLLQREHASHPILTPLALPSATYFVLSALVALALAVFLELRRGSASMAQRICWRGYGRHATGLRGYLARGRFFRG